MAYKSKDGRVRWRARDVDASGRRVQETIGYDLTAKEARERLEELLVDVRKEHRKKRQPITLERFAREWIDERDDERSGLKRSTRRGYRAIIETHLIPALGRRPLAVIDGPVLADYIRAKDQAGLGPATINRHLNLLHKLYEDARCDRGLVRSNPAKDVRRPREPRRRHRALKPAEIAAVLRAFGELEQDDWTRQVRTMFLVLVATGLRRGELLGLRWKDVSIAVPGEETLTVRETWVCGAPDTPKSEAGERTLKLGGAVADELFQHRARSRFQGDDERVFCHPRTGHPLNAQKYAKTLRAALAKAGVGDLERPTHDLRVTNATQAWLAGMSRAGLQTRLGPADFKTTQLYINAAGELFPAETELLEARVFGHTLGHNGASPP
jgi:site-specific recombinase XerD